MNNKQNQFRVWDVTNKKFLPQSHFAILGNGKLIVSDSGHYNHFTNTNKNDYVVQEYTGIMDSYGKEICQGDIVTNKTSQEEYCSPAVIVWGNYEFGGFALAYKNNHLKDYHAPLIHKINGVDLIEEFRLSKMGIYQIVGNVFDTPELIK